MIPCSKNVMAVLLTPIHVPGSTANVDARVKPAHDGIEWDRMSESIH